MNIIGELLRKCTVGVTGGPTVFDDMLYQLMSDRVHQCLSSHSPF